MKLLTLGYAMIVGVVMTTTPIHADTATLQPYTCEADKDCDQHFTNTVCIKVNNNGTDVRKCTPNTKARPACRGAQPGMCPSYQSADMGYLNLQCVFVADSDFTIGSSGGADSTTVKSLTSSSTSRRHRYLMSEVGMANATTNTTTPAPKGTPTSNRSAADSSGGSVGSAGSGSTADDKPGLTPKSSTIVVINNVNVTGHFACVDVSDCPQQAYDPSSCYPKECGPDGALEQCNTHGTCTYSTSITKRKCMCQRGYSGDKCQTEVSGQCDVDCGPGGNCVDGMCKCKKGFDGKNYKGKAGKPNRRCTKCTNDQACQNGNLCDIETGKCVCSPGYSGPTCGATEDGCTKKTCGRVGKCQTAANGTGVCYCPLCRPTCEICKTKDCSTCPSLASSIGFSKTALLVSVIVSVLVSTFA